MKVAKNTMFMDDLSHIDTLHIPYKDLKPSVREALKLEGLYALERIFGVECDGHGCGCGGEDISFTLESGTKINPHDHAIVFEVTDNGRKLEVAERIVLFSHKDINHGGKIRWDYGHEIENESISKALVRIIRKKLVK